MAFTCAKYKRNPFLKVCHHFFDFYSNPVLIRFYMLKRDIVLLIAQKLQHLSIYNILREAFYYHHLQTV